MNQPTIFNPQYVIELRRTLVNGLTFCDTLERFAGIATTGTGTIRAHSLAGNGRIGGTGTTGRIVSEATKAKMRASAKRRARLKLHQGGNVRAA